MRWSQPGEQLPELVAQRRAIYGGELGWVDDDAEVAWDAYDGYSSALLVYDNFRVIKKWNNSTYFAAAVGYIADSIDRG